MKSKYYKHPKALVSPKAKVGEGTRVWAFVNIQDRVRIGQGCNICDGCFIERGVTIGNHVTLKNNISVYDGVTIEDDVFCGTNAVFINDRHPRSHQKDSWVLERTLIKKGATIGSNATVLCGVTIGAYAFVGAGSIVTKDVPAHGIVYGNPARFRGYVCRCGKNLKKNFVCVCGMKYKLKGETLMLHG